MELNIFGKLSIAIYLVDEMEYSIVKQANMAERTGTTIWYNSETTSDWNPVGSNWLRWWKSCEVKAEMERKTFSVNIHMVNLDRI